MASVYHLHHLKLDHSPLLVELEEGRNPNSGCHLLQFQVAWFTHENFWEFVKNNCLMNMP